MSESQRVVMGRLAVDPLTFSGAVERILGLAKERRAAYVVTPNADHVVRAERDPEFVRICAGADLALADGMPLVWMARLRGEPLPERISGADLLPALCAAAAREGGSIFLLGGLEGEAEAAAANLSQNYPGLKIAGIHYPPFGFDSDPVQCQSIVAAINAANPDIVFVGVGSPKQEKWIDRWRTGLRCGVLIGVGTAIAFAAGTVRRAPRLMQVTGTEWLFRLLQEPGRLLGRYVRDVEFFWIARKSR